MKKWLISLSVAAILPACVTINVYFPAAAAEKAADKIIEEVWQLKDAETKPKVTTPSVPRSQAPTSGAPIPRAPEPRAPAPKPDANPAETLYK